MVPRLTDYGLEGDRNYGMSSVFMGEVTHPTAFPFRSASVHNPARKIMFAEEPSSVGGADNPPQSNGLSIQDGRWLPGNMWTSDYLTTRHAGKAEVAFADGHVAAANWRFGTYQANSRPDL
jgi:prepilin-type processing-associated H-X9-DG protein